MESSNQKKLFRLLMGVAIVVAAFGLGRSLGHQSAGSSTSENNDPIVENFISQSPLTAPQFGGKVFIAYKTLGETPEGTGKILYVWAYIQEYYKDGTSLGKGSGSSVPIAIHMKSAGQFYLPTSYETPRDGDLYSEDLQKMFPKNIQDLITGKNTRERNAEIKKLEDQTEMNARAYFKL